MKKDKELILLGTGAFAQVAYEYFQYDSDYEVVAFSVEEEYLKEDTKCGLPVVPMETLCDHYCPDQYYFFASLVYNQMNRLRTRMFNFMKSKGYKPASYISSRSFVWKNVKIGEHCFIFEDNTIQPFVEIGDNVILWSGNHIGHHSKIDNNCFLSSHVVVSGFCVIKNNCFLGVNSTLANNITIEKDCFIGSGAIITKDTNEAQVVSPPHTEASKVSSLRLFRVKD